MRSYKAIALGSAMLLSLGFLPPLVLPDSQPRTPQSLEDKTLRFFVDDLRSGKKKKVVKAEVDLLITDIVVSTFEQTEFSIWIDKEVIFKHYIGSYSPLVVHLESGWQLKKGSTLRALVKNGRGRVNVTGRRE